MIAKSEDYIWLGEYMFDGTPYYVKASNANLQEVHAVEKKQPNFTRFQNNFKRRGR